RPAFHHRFPVPDGDTELDPNGRSHPREYGFLPGSAGKGLCPAQDAPAWGRAFQMGGIRSLYLCLRGKRTHERGRGKYPARYHPGKWPADRHTGGRLAGRFERSRTLCERCILIMVNNDNLSAIERIKQKSNGLRGTLTESLRNEVTGAISEEDTALLKFH